MKSGPRNLITDVEGLLVGNASDAALKSGVTVLTARERFAAAVHVMGGAPGTRETDLLAPENTIDQVDALVLSGGSAFGLDAAQGVVDGLRAAGRGLKLHDMVIPLVPAAIVFDLPNGGDKSWAKNPYPELGREAFDAAGEEFALGTEGGGTGATTVNLKGGLGSASAVLSSGITVGALTVVNPVGSVTVGDGPEFWAAPFEQDGEFGGLGPAPMRDWQVPLTKLHAREATAIAIVATDAALTKPALKRMAIAAHDGIARAMVPSHTPYDGDLVFSASTAVREVTDPVLDPLEIGHAAALCLSRAAARAVYHARPEPGDTLPTWGQRFG
jgi:D-aminopeptidase